MLESAKGYETNFHHFISSLASFAHAKVSLDEARSLVGNSSVMILDIREPDEHATGVAKGMKLIPMSTLESRLNELPKNPNSRVLLICNTQNRSSAVDLPPTSRTKLKLVKSVKLEQDGHEDDPDPVSLPLGS